METIVIIAGIREMLVLYRWLLVKFAKEPKKAATIIRLVLLRHMRNTKRGKYVKIMLKENDRK